MLRLAFQIEDGRGVRRVDVGPATIVAWERRTSRRISDMAEGVSAEDMAWLVWHADKKAGNTSATFDEYLETLLDLEDAPSPKASTAEAASDG
jgi:hypothetical protein